MEVEDEHHVRFRLDVRVQGDEAVEGGFSCWYVMVEKNDRADTTVYPPGEAGRLSREHRHRSVGTGRVGLDVEPVLRQCRAAG